MAVRKARFVTAENQALPRAGFEVGLQAGHEGVVLIADRGMRVVEDRRRACGHRLVGQIQRS